MIKAIKNGMLKTSLIGAVALMIGVAASETPLTPGRLLMFAVSLTWITLFLTANRKEGR